MYYHKGNSGCRYLVAVNLSIRIRVPFDIARRARRLAANTLAIFSDKLNTQYGTSLSKIRQMIEISFQGVIIGDVFGGLNFKSIYFVDHFRPEP
ncbi:hypothetical protein EVAR_33471_1 [Eumeta japonica]|uniref:Uncharacterized protein n=1 Tax=Eumeta variegata TaxID=151549 RepID=A0A4C1WHW2_EUMVA|nr:hypothetical protein EVAR_33471_1 [Eumeta japonica]